MHTCSSDHSSSNRGWGGAMRRKQHRSYKKGQESKASVSAHSWAATFLCGRRGGRFFSSSLGVDVWQLVRLWGHRWGEEASFSLPFKRLSNYKQIKFAREAICRRWHHFIGILKSFFLKYFNNVYLMCMKQTTQGFGEWPLCFFKKAELVKLKHQTHVICYIILVSQSQPVSQRGNVPSDTERFIWRWSVLSALWVNSFEKGLKSCTAGLISVCSKGIKV